MSIVRVGIVCWVDHVFIIKTCKIKGHFVIFSTSSTWISLLNNMTYADVHLVFYIFHVFVSPISLILSFPVFSAVNSTASGLDLMPEKEQWITNAGNLYFHLNRHLHSRILLMFLTLPAAFSAHCSPNAIMMQRLANPHLAWLGVRCVSPPTEGLRRSDHFSDVSEHAAVAPHGRNG